MTHVLALNAALTVALMASGPAFAEQASAQHTGALALEIRYCACDVFPPDDVTVPAVTSSFLEQSTALSVPAPIATEAHVTSGPISLHYQIEPDRTDTHAFLLRYDAEMTFVGIEGEAKSSGQVSVQHDAWTPLAQASHTLDGTEHHVSIAVRLITPANPAP